MISIKTAADPYDSFESFEYSDSRPYTYNSSGLHSKNKEEIDWRSSSKVSPVRDITKLVTKKGQKPSAACVNSYAFAVTDLVESVFAIERGFIKRLSVQ